MNHHLRRSLYIGTYASGISHINKAVVRGHACFELRVLRMYKAVSRDNHGLVGLMCGLYSDTRASRIADLIVDGTCCGHDGWTDGHDWYWVHGLMWGTNILSW